MWVRLCDYFFPSGVASWESVIYEKGKREREREIHTERNRETETLRETKKFRDRETE